MGKIREREKEMGKERKKKELGFVVRKKIGKKVRDWREKDG